MINHARTLLLNIFAQSADKQLAGYEYIPVEYRPLVLPQNLKTLRRVLFGSQPDQRFLNLRARELMSYVHQTELAEYAYKLDPRITYWPERAAAEFQFPTGIVITQIRGTPRSVAVGGDFIANNGTGRAQRQYTVGFAGVNEIPIVLEEVNTRYLLSETDDQLLEQPPGDTAGFVLDVAAIKDPQLQEKKLLQGSLPTLTLPETEVRIKLAELPTDPDTYDGRWYIKLTANPVPAITSLLPTLEILGEPAFLELFGVADEEPYTTFKNVWFDHPLPAYRLAGLVLALIYRTEQARLHR